MKSELLGPVLEAELAVRVARVAGDVTANDWETLEPVLDVRLEADEMVLMELVARTIGGEGDVKTRFAWDLTGEAAGVTGGVRWANEGNSQFSSNTRRRRTYRCYPASWTAGLRNAGRENPSRPLPH